MKKEKDSKLHKSMTLCKDTLNYFGYIMNMSQCTGESTLAQFLIIGHFCKQEFDKSSIQFSTLL